MTRQHTDEKLSAVMTKVLAESPRVNDIVWLHVDELEDSPYQFRPIDPAATENRSQQESLAQEGVLQNILVRPVSGKTHKGIKYQIIFGHRRVHNSREVAKTKPERAYVPAKVGEYSDLQAAELALIENVQRKDPSDWAIAQGIRKVMELSELEGKPLSLRDLAKRITKEGEEGEGKAVSVSYVRNHLELFKLRPQLQEVAQRRNKVRLSLFEIQKVKDDPEVERELIEQVDRDRPVGYQAVKQQVENYLREEQHKRDSQKPDAQTTAGVSNLTKRQRDAQANLKRLALEVTGKLSAMASYADDAGEEFLEEEIAPRTKLWRSQLNRLGKE